MARDGWIRGTAAAALAVLATLTVAGCSSDSTSPADSAASSDSGSAKATGKPAGKAGAEADAKTGVKAAVGGGTIGGPGSPCAALPVTFDIAADWKAAAVTMDPDPEVAALLGRQGPVEAACELDAKPAGNIGYIRVWTGKPGADTPRKVLQRFVAAEKGAGAVTYRETTAGTLPATEVTYTVTVELLDESKKERAFAVATPSGPVVVHLGGLDTGEHEAMLPAYELARKTLRLG
ncbi:lipoprotein [Streptomyces sp. DT24]|uniref:lipoprotein n=1 Tax=Streptomyces sp. DT24 TaxID=3416520 RepID=UPI003CEE61C1